MQLKKKKYFISFVNADVRNLSERIRFSIKEKAKDLFLSFICYAILFDYMLEFHKQ